MIKLIPYKRFSKSAKVLAQALRAKRIITPTYRQRYRDLLINWGSSRLTQRISDWTRVLNPPESVSKASNKLTALQTMSQAGVATIEFTTDRSVASSWLTEERMVVARHILNGHSGNGAQIIETGEIPYAPLYTKYARKDAEYRLHVFRGEIIDYVRKKKRNGYEGDSAFNPHIRTHQFGWVFCRDGVQPPECVKLEAIKAVQALGLDFGAVDIIYRERYNKCWVLEVNTAPGLEGTTVQRYVDKIQSIWYNSR